MYVYSITNKVNGKQYIGITNNYQKRWSNHRCCNNPNMVIAKAIMKYGLINFEFKLLYQGLSIEEASNKEIELIQELNTLAPNGYNVALGGMYVIGNTVHEGHENSKALLTEEEAKYIKEHRDQPEYLLYEEFNEKISYEAFKKVYLGKTYKNVKAKEVPIYPFNMEFSNQFTSNNALTYDEVVELRKQYNDGVYWRKAFEPYQEKFQNEWSFWRMYTGLTYKLVMPEVFTEKNKRKHASLKNSGANNGHAKLTEEDVLEIRRLFSSKEKTKKELYKLYDFVKPSAVDAVIARKTWKNI